MGVPYPRHEAQGPLAARLSLQVQLLKFSALFCGNTLISDWTEKYWVSSQPADGVSLQTQTVK